MTAPLGHNASLFIISYQHPVQNSDENETFHPTISILFFDLVGLSASADTTSGDQTTGTRTTTFQLPSFLTAPSTSAAAPFQMAPGPKLQFGTTFSQFKSGRTMGE